MLKHTESGLFWAGIFLIGSIVGYAFHAQLLPPLSGTIKTGIDVGNYLSLLNATALLTFTIIWVKNLLVGLFCVLAGRITRGLVPLIVCIVNGMILGIFAVLFSNQGVDVWRFAVALLPHGVIELPAIFLACGIGMKALAIKERLLMFRILLAMLAVAAVIETWVSPIVVAKMIA